MDNLHYLSYRIHSELELPSGIQLNPDGIVKSLRVLAKVASFAKFEITAQEIRGVLKQSVNECLRNGCMQALSCNDLKTALKCMAILQNVNNLNATNFSLASNSYHGDNGSIRKNVSSLSLPNRLNQGNKLDVSASLGRTDFSNHLAVINEYEEKTKGKVGYDSELDRNRRQKIPYESQGPSRRWDSQPRRSRSVGTRSSKRTNYYPSEKSLSPSPSKYRQQVKSKRGTNAPLSDSEVLLDGSGNCFSTESLRYCGKAESGKISKVNGHYGKCNTEADNHLQRSDSEDSDELFRPSQSKKLFLERKRGFESRYKQLSSRGNGSGSLETSDVSSDDSSPQHMPRKAGFLSKHLRKQKTFYSENDREILQKEDYDRGTFNERSIGTKKSKLAKRYPSKSSPSPSPPKYKQPKRGKITAFLSNSEIVSDGTSKQKPTQNNNKLVDSEPRLTKSKKKVAGKSDMKKVNKPAANKVQTKAGKSNEKPTVRGKVSSLQLKEKELPHSSTDEAGPSSSNQIKFLSKLKEVESSTLDYTPDTEADKRRAHSKKSSAVNKNSTASNKKTQKSAKKGKNCRTPFKSPISEGKQKPSTSKAKTRKSPMAQSHATGTQKAGAGKHPKKPISYNLRNNQSGCLYYHKR